MNWFSLTVHDLQSFGLDNVSTPRTYICGSCHSPSQAAVIRSQDIGAMGF